MARNPKLRIPFTTDELYRLKKVVDAIKDLVQDCNFDCNDSGIALQAMDNSHVALVSMMLKSESFSPFRCDRNIALGINLTSLMKVLRAAQNNDILTLKAEDAPDVVNLVFESANSDRISEYDIKLMDIDQEHLGIPETEYAATISMPSTEFQRICRDLMAISESGSQHRINEGRPIADWEPLVGIECTKEGVKFSAAGDIGSGSVTLRSHSDVEKPENNVEINLSEPVALTFSLKYLVNFCKATGLSTQVKLCLSSEVPLLVEYALSNNSYLRFYLAPKVSRFFYSVDEIRIVGHKAYWDDRSVTRIDSKPYTTIHVPIVITASVVCSRCDLGPRLSKNKRWEPGYLLGSYRLWRTKGRVVKGLKGAYHWISNLIVPDAPQIGRVSFVDISVGRGLGSRFYRLEPQGPANVTAHLH